MEKEMIMTEVPVKKVREVLNKRLNTQRRIITLSNREVIIIHPGFLKKIGAIKKNEVENIQFNCITKGNKEVEPSLLKVKTLIQDNDGVLKIIDNQDNESYLTSRNFYGIHEKVVVPKTDKKLMQHLSIEHKPSVAAVVHLKNLNCEIDELKKFSNLFIEKYLNKNNQSLKVSTLSEKGITDRLNNVFNDNRIDQAKVKSQYKSIFDSMVLEMGSKLHNTSSIDFESMKYLMENVPEKWFN